MIVPKRMPYLTRAACLCGIMVLSYPSHAIASCVLDEYSIMRFFLMPTSTDVTPCQGKITKSQMINGLKVAGTYWDPRTMDRDRYTMLSKKYQEIIGKVYSITKPEQYVIPMSEPERVWQGYKINEVNVVAPDSLEVSVQVKWEQEGYAGTMTYMMVLVVEGGRWVIANVHY